MEKKMWSIKHTNSDELKAVVDLWLVAKMPSEK
jgi:hypothetical protein